jgi:hypothetical protein
VRLWLGVQAVVCPQSWQSGSFSLLQPLNRTNSVTRQWQVRGTFSTALKLPHFIHARRFESHCFSLRCEEESRCFRNVARARACSVEFRTMGKDLFLASDTLQVALLSRHFMAQLTSSLLQLPNTDKEVRRAHLLFHRTPLYSAPVVQLLWWHEWWQG